VALPHNHLIGSSAGTLDSRAQKKGPPTVLSIPFIGSYDSRSPENPATHSSKNPDTAVLIGP
jgi:hypothetical protein